MPDACDIAEGRSGDADGDGVPDECDTGSPADLDRSGGYSRAMRSALVLVVWH